MHPEVYSQPGRIFSITIGTSPRSAVFSDIAFGLRCIDELRSFADSGSIKVWAYCFMPDHVHLLVEPRDVSLHAFVRTWKSRCYHIRRAMRAPEPFWQRSFFDHALRHDEDLLRAADYILANPVRGGLVTSSSDYPLCGSFEFGKTSLSR